MDADVAGCPGVGLTALMSDRRWTTPEMRLRRQYWHSFAAAACVGPFLSYVLTDLGWTPREIGYAAAVLTASAVITAPAWGWLDDASQRGAARFSFLATAVAATFLTFAVSNLGIVPALCAVVLVGSASGSLEPLLTTGALRNARTAYHLGATRSLGSVGWICGLGIGGALLTVTDQTALVFLLAGVLAISAPLVPAVSGPSRVESGPTLGAPRPGRPPIRAVLGVLSLTFPVSLCMSALVFFTAGWAHSDLGAGPLLAVGPLALSALLELPAFVVVDRLSRSIAPRSLCGMAFPPLAVACLALGVAPGTAIMFGVQPLVALSLALWFVGQSRLTAERVDLRQLAIAMTLVSTLGRGLAGPLAGIGGGAIAAAGGYDALFFTMAALCALGFARVFLPLLISSQYPNSRRIT